MILLPGCQQALLDVTSDRTRRTLDLPRGNVNENPLGGLIAVDQTG
jgi:hypothetical protein